MRGIGWGSGGRDRAKKKSRSLSPVNSETAEPIEMKLGGYLGRDPETVNEKKIKILKIF